MRCALEPSYILHSRPYRESSLLLEAYSREHGRTGLVARGGRGPRSRWKNMLQPFRPLLLSWSQRGELGTLTGADQVAAPPNLEGEALICGLYANELLMKFLQRGDPHPGLFDDYGDLLGRLAAEAAVQPLLRLFEYRLLAATGFGLQLDHEAGSDREIDPGGSYRYLPESGAQPEPRDAANDAERISGAALLALKSGHIEERHLQELKSLMRRVIRYHLGDRAIVTQKMFVR